MCTALEALVASCDFGSLCECIVSHTGDPLHLCLFIYCMTDNWLQFDAANFTATRQLCVLHFYVTVGPWVCWHQKHHKQVSDCETQRETERSEQNVHPTKA